MSQLISLGPNNIKRYLSGKIKPGIIYKVSSIQDDLINIRLSQNYQIVEKIGIGAMSLVYKAVQDPVKRPVAIKILKKGLSQEGNLVKRFLAEAKALSRLNHPNLITIHDIGTRNTQPFYVMEYIEGKPLSKILEQENHLKPQRAINIFDQICSALDHAHKHNIIHRDLKPDNIMLVNNALNKDQVKLIDFGIAKLSLDSQIISQKLTQTGEVWGSPVYMSPEQCAGKTVDMRSDIYALGTVMYEVLTGKMAFNGNSVADVVLKQLDETPPAFKIIRPDLDIPKSLENIVFKCLQKDANKRFQTMQELKVALSKTGMPIDPSNTFKLTYSNTTKTETASQSKQRSNHIAIIIFASTILLAICVLSFYIYRELQYSPKEKELPQPQTQSITSPQTPTIIEKAPTTPATISTENLDMPRQTINTDSHTSNNKKSFSAKKHSSKTKIKQYIDQDIDKPITIKTPKKTDFDQWFNFKQRQ
jgi:serine/threonine protein kinase